MFSYSVVEKSVYCKACVLHLSEEKKETLGAFVWTGFKRWKHFHDSIISHNKSKYHIQAAADMLGLKERFSQDKLTIKEIISSQLQQKRDENKQILQCVIEVKLLYLMYSLDIASSMLF